MPRIIETTVYGIDELPDEAKEAARAWYRESCLDYEWYDFVYEDFGRICEILGVTLATTTAWLQGGGTRDKPCIYWSGFSCQGDGASFQGWWSHARGARKPTRLHGPTPARALIRAPAGCASRSSSDRSSATPP